MITAGKISPIVDGVYVSVAIGLYSMTFLLTDFIGEVHSKKEALQAVYMGILAELLVLLAINLSMHVSPAPFWEHQEAFETTFKMAPRIMLASITAFVTAQLMDVTIFDILKKRSNGKYLALRNNASTFVGQTLDSIIFYTVAFYGVIPGLWKLIITTCIIKYIIALVDTPFVYLARAWAHKGKKSQKPTAL
jgi:uncharacterized integral membrane protein (TIGR00697 family)